MKKLIVVSALSLAGLTAFNAHAESNLVIGTGSATARLDFRVVVPRVLFLGVGTGAATTPLANNTTVDRVTFDYTTNPDAVGGGPTATAGSITNTGGFAGNAIPVRVFGNNGQIVVTATNPVNLVNASTPADTIPFSQISGTSSDTALPVPAVNGGTSSPTFNAGSTKVTSRTANWTFAYANAASVAAGTYNGQVTYTASMP